MGCQPLHTTEKIGKIIMSDSHVHIINSFTKATSHSLLHLSASTRKNPIKVEFYGEASNHFIFLSVTQVK